MAIPVMRFAALPRPRLLAALTGPQGPAPLTLLRAPAGFGKTALAAEWARHEEGRGMRVRWVRAPETGDALWRLLAAALDVDPGSDEDPRAAVERAVTALEAPALIVIDDFGRLTAPVLDRALAELLERTAHLHLAVLSPRFAVLDGPLSTARVPAVVLTAEDLAFDEAEALALARLLGVRNLAAAELLRVRVRGWPGAVAGILPRIDGGGSARDIDARLAGIAQHHLGALSDPAAPAVFAIIVLCEGIGRETLAELSGLSPAELRRALDELEDHGLVEASWYPETTRLRALAGAGPLLRSRAIRRLGAERARGMIRRHAMELSGEEPRAAVEQLLAAGEHALASQVFVRNFLELLDDPAQVRDALRPLPMEVLRRTPVLAGGLLLAEISSLEAAPERLDALQRLLRAAAEAGRSDDDAEVRVAVITMLIAALRMRGSDIEALDLAAELEREIALVSPESLVGLRGSMSLIHAVIGLTGMLHGDLWLAERSFARTLAHARQQGDRAEQLRGLYGLLATTALLGQFTRTAGLLREADELRGATGLEGPQLSWVNAVVARVFLAVERRDVELSESELARVDMLIDRVEQGPLLLVAKAAMERLRSGDRAALALFRGEVRRLNLSYRVSAFQLLTLKAFQADLTMTLGNDPAAARLLEPLPEHPLARSARARLQLFRGDAGSARSLAEPLLEAPAPRIRTDALVVSAVACWELEEREEALRLLDLAAGLMREHGTTRVLGLVPYAPLLDLVRAADRIDLSELVEDLPATLRCERFETLTPAERRILDALRTGATLSAIAGAHFLTANTVKSHVRGIYRKLRVAGRDEALVRAAERGLFEGRAGV